MYVKIFEDILDSSVWDEALATRVVWLTMLIMCDEEGVVRASTSGIRRRAVVSEAEVQQALKVLSSPDTDSKDKGYGGRRIEQIDGGFLVLNYKKYREIRTKKQLQDAERQRRYYEKKKREASQDLTHLTTIASASASASEVEIDGSRSKELVQGQIDLGGEEETGTEIVVRDSNWVEQHYEQLAARDWAVARPKNEAMVAFKYHRYRNNIRAKTVLTDKRERIAVELLKTYGLVGVLLAIDGQLTHPDKNPQDGRKYRTWDHLFQAQNGPSNIEKCRDHAIARGEFKYVLGALAKLQEERGWTPTATDRELMDSIAPQQGGGNA